MGSCYSCRSNGGPPTYSTVAMADTKDKRKVPYARGSATSFGFKKRVPATLKSLSQERTGELVSQYENKIANLGGTNQTGVCNGGNLGNVNFSDDNCNDIMLVNSLAPTKQIPSNRVNSMLGSPKKMAAGRENVPNQITTIQNDDARNGNDKRASYVKGSQESVASRASSIRLPQKLRTTFSGLPQPQVPIYISKTNVARTLTGTRNAQSDFKTETHLRTPAEPMQTSTDTIANDDGALLDGDSGIGNSVSDRRNDGDTETLAEVDQIEGDSVSLSSINRERLAEKSNAILVELENKQCKKEAEVLKKNSVASPKGARPSGIARPKSVIPSKIAQPKPRNSSPVLTEKVIKITAPSQISQLQQPKSFKKKQPVPGDNAKMVGDKAVPKSSPKRKVCPKFSKDSKKGGVAGSNLRNDLGGSGEEWKVIAELRQKENITPDMEEVEIKPITLCLQKQATESKVGCKSPKMEANIVGRRAETPKKADSESATKTKSSGHPANDVGDNFMNDMGPYSPPSEKDFFLIDDEIADQPALIACQSLDASAYRHMRLQSDNLSDMNEEGGFPALASTPLSISIPRRAAAYSLDSMSPCSSLGSEDLMLDFDRTEEGPQDTHHSRTICEVLEDGGQGDFENDGRCLQTTKQYGHAKSPTVGRIYEEWSQMMGSNHAEGSAPGCGTSSSLKYRSNRQEGNLSSLNVSAKNAIGSSEHNSNSHSVPIKIPAASSGSSYLARRSIASTLRPPKQMSVAEADDGSARIDSTSYHSMCQDVTNVKTMLLRLKRVLQENGLFLNLANNDPPDGVTAGRTSESEDGNASIAEMEQANADLRRQVVFFQQQMEEKDRTIKLLQQQMAKYSASHTHPDNKEMSNAACQTERQKSLMGNSLSSSSEESTFGATVSFRIGKEAVPAEVQPEAACPVGESHEAGLDSSSSVAFSC